MQPYGLFSSFPSCAWERVIARQATLGIGKAPSAAWVAIGFPSATWEPEDKIANFIYRLNPDTNFLINSCV
jgi:hypothetical protein